MYTVKYVSRDVKCMMWGCGVLGKLEMSGNIGATFLGEEERRKDGKMGSSEREGLHEASRRINIIVGLLITGSLFRMCLWCA